VSTRVASLVGNWFAASPLRHATFRAFYVGAIGAALGYTMQATTAAWLMATLTPSPLMVASVQTASTLPSLLFGLVAGALADIVDRRRIVLATQFVLVALAALLGAATLAGVIGPATLLAGTFLIGAGFAFYLPAQQAAINDLVARAELPRAVALNAVAFNVARAAGPALAGAIAASLGSGSALVAAAAFFVVMIVAALRERPKARTLRGIPETVVSGVLAGMRFARHSAPMRALLTRNLSFSLCASALWALLPLVAREELGLGAGGYGTLVGCFGAGAVVGALSIPRQLHRFSLNTVVTSGAVLWALAVSLVASTSQLAVAVVGACGAGAAWVTALASLSAGTQSVAPAWVRARAVATNLVTNQASLAIGSIVWGTIASYSGVRIALGVSAAAMLVLLALNWRIKVSLAEEADVTPGAQLPDLAIALEPSADDGPVLIQIDYQVDGANREEFLRAIHAIEPVRRRNGATSWRVFRDLEEEGRFVERYIIASWAEYMRLRTRMTMADRRLIEHVQHLQRPDVPMRVSRFLGIGRDELPRGAAH
jgi:MFS family permease